MQFRIGQPFEGGSIMSSDQIIEVRPYEEHKGKLKSLKYLGASDGKWRTNGSILPGAQFAGVLEEDEEVTCTDGCLIINGQEVPKGETIIVKAGEKIDFQAKEASSYICIYG